MTERRPLCTMATLSLGYLAVVFPASAQVSSVRTADGATFRPETFFLGHTEGTGRLKIMFRRRRIVYVHGNGRIDQSGALVLDQEVDDADGPLKHREWKMRSLGGGRYAATLSDATGPVVGTVEGNTLRLAFPAKGGLRIWQVLVLSSDGRSARNRLTIRKMGIVVAKLYETITRAD
jgi:hypothetical protein